MATNLTKEDIQAIAQELRNIQAKEEPNAQARAQSQNIRKNEGQKPTKKQPRKSGEMSKNVGFIGLILVWALVFVALAIKVAPYI